MGLKTYRRQLTITKDTIYEYHGYNGDELDEIAEQLKERKNV